jgi:hypothetical protein
MSIEAIGLVQARLHSLGINYEFGTWTNDPIYPYFVGEYQESESMTEDGLQESTFILNGFHRGKWLELEQVKDQIEKTFKDGEMIITASGSGVVISYSDSLIIPTGDAELKRIQINLKIKEWKVN